MMDFELPVLVPPDDLPLDGAYGGASLTISRCQLVAHNVAPDGKVNPVESDDPYFVFLYQHGDAFFQVRGLNPEMMSGERITPSDADRLLSSLPYRVL